MADLFKDIMPSILQTKQNVLVEEKDYNPYVINRSLSFHYDCVAYANMMNAMPLLDRRMQYDFYLNTLRAYKRPFQKWQKRETVENLDAIKEYYKYSNEQAKEALAVLTSDEIDEIRRRLDKGGIDVKSKRTSRGNPS